MKVAFRFYNDSYISLRLHEKRWTYYTEKATQSQCPSHQSQRETQLRLLNNLERQRPALLHTEGFGLKAPDDINPITCC